MPDLASSSVLAQVHPVEAPEGMRCWVGVLADNPEVLVSVQAEQGADPDVALVERVCREVGAWLGAATTAVAGAGARSGWQGWGAEVSFTSDGRWSVQLADPPTGSGPGVLGRLPGTGFLAGDDF